MTLKLSVPQYDELKPRITVFGVGGAGGNAVNNMISKELDGVEFVVATFGHRLGPGGGIAPWKGREEIGEPFFFLPD